MGLFDDIFKKKGMPEKLNIGGKEIEINADAMVYSQMALDAYKVQNYTDAIVNFDKAINAQPNNQNFYTMRGTVYEDMGNDVAAERDFRKNLELSPNSYIGAYRLGMVYFRKKDFENAINWLKKSYNNLPDGDLEGMGLGKQNIMFVAKKVVIGNLGNFLTQVKRFEEGIKYLDEAIEIDPNYPNPYMAKGMAYAQMGEPRKGIPFLQKAAKLGIPQAEMAINMLEQLAQEQEMESSSNEELELDFVFHSSDHLRYENGIHTSGPHGGAPRAIKVEANISGNEGYTVTMFNTDGGQANVQMAPKQMKLVGLDNQKIQLRGYGNDNFGASFSDYGLTIHHNEGNIEKCILHMYDRNVDIEYLN
ncbi:tetratricopeptide repeat protein [Xanthomarina gelatinilytica]|uniref:tetratricopeptide repeat protein n=1 Tax=Xanthomarina gelatinilytica TaxID=1137281 RepID=UPI003AA7D5A8